MVSRHAATLLSIALVSAIALPVRAAEALAPKPRVVDPVKLKAQDLERQRLLAKLHADAPKLVEPGSGANPLDAPIFHRYDRP